MRSPLDVTASIEHISFFVELERNQVSDWFFDDLLNFCLTFTAPWTSFKSTENLLLNMYPNKFLSRFTCKLVLEIH